MTWPSNCGAQPEHWTASAPGLEGTKRCQARQWTKNYRSSGRCLLCLGESQELESEQAGNQRFPMPLEIHEALRRCACQSKERGDPCLNLSKCDAATQLHQSKHLTWLGLAAYTCITEDFCLKRNSSAAQEICTKCIDCWRNGNNRTVPVRAFATSHFRQLKPQTKPCSRKAAAASWPRICPNSSRIARRNTRRMAS